MLEGWYPLIEVGVWQVFSVLFCCYSPQLSWTMGWRDAGGVAWLQFISLNQCFTQLLLKSRETSRHCVTDSSRDVSRLRATSIAVTLHLCKGIWTAVFDFQWLKSGLFHMALQVYSQVKQIFNSVFCCKVCLTSLALWHLSVFIRKIKSFIKYVPLE